jgi:hypothetical protein
MNTLQKPSINLDDKNMAALGLDSDVRTEWQAGEKMILNNTYPAAGNKTNAQDYCPVMLDAELLYRKLYFFADCQGYPDHVDVAPYYYVKGNLKFTRGSKLLASIPVSFGRDVQAGYQNMEACLASVSGVFPAGGASGDDAVQLTLSRHVGRTMIAANRVVRINPYHMIVNCDQVVFELKESYLLYYIGVWIGVMSSNRQW